MSIGSHRLLERYVDAFQRYDVDGLVALLREDATLSMPPLRHGISFLDPEKLFPLFGLSPSLAH